MESYSILFCFPTSSRFTDCTQGRTGSISWGLTDSLASRLYAETLFYYIKCGERATEQERERDKMHNNTHVSFYPIQLDRVEETHIMAQYSTGENAKCLIRGSVEMAVNRWMTLPSVAQHNTLRHTSGRTTYPSYRTNNNNSLPLPKTRLMPFCPIPPLQPSALCFSKGLGVL